MGTGDSTGTSMSAHSIPSPWPTTTLYHPFQVNHILVGTGPGTPLLTMISIEALVLPDPYMDTHIDIELIIVNTMNTNERTVHQGVVQLWLYPGSIQQSSVHGLSPSYQCTVYRDIDIDRPSRAIVLLIVNELANRNTGLIHGRSIGAGRRTSNYTLP